MRRGARVIAALLVVPVMAAACSGDAGETTPVSAVASTTTSVAPSTSTSTTTTVPVSVPVSTTTSEPSSTVPEVTEPLPPSDPVTTTSLPEGVPPRVTFPDDPDKQAVVDAAYAFFDAARAAQAAPADESLRLALADTMTDPIAEQLTAYLNRLDAAGERIVASEKYPTYLEIFEFTVFAVDGSGIFDACAVDGDVRVSGEPGDEVLVSHEFGSVLVTFSLVDSGVGWTVRDTEVFGRFPGALTCDG